jgi:ATP-dependent Clp protease ATP-binding subunit ClpA
MVVFNALGEAELRQVAEIELRRVQERILSSKAAAFVFRLTEEAVDQLLEDGTDPRYGARHLRRAIDRLLVQPISNLVASEQVRGGDCIMVEADPGSKEMIFRREAESLSPATMARLAQMPFCEERSTTAAKADRAEHRLVRRFQSWAG